MAVVYAVLGRAKPGRWEDCLHDASHAAKVFERHGVDRVHFAAAAVAGEADGQWVMSVEFDSAAAYGEAFERIMADEEMQGIVRAGKSAEAAAIVESSSLMVAVPVPGEVNGRGTVSEIHLSRLTPGHLPQMLSLTEQAFGVVRRNGAVGAHLYQLVFAGSMSGHYVATFDYPDLATFGVALDGWGTDPDAQTLATRLSSADAPMTIVSSSLYTEISL